MTRIIINYKWIQLDLASKSYSVANPLQCDWTWSLKWCINNKSSSSYLRSSGQKSKKDCDRETRGSRGLREVRSGSRGTRWSNRPLMLIDPPHLSWISTSGQSHRQERLTDSKSTKGDFSAQRVRLIPDRQSNFIWLKIKNIYIPLYKKII